MELHPVHRNSKVRQRLNQVNVNYNNERKVAWRCLTREELLVYADDPWWKKTRKIAALIPLAVLAGTLGYVIFLLATAPKCADVQTLEWWQKDIIYSILPRSFLDTDDDGSGDLKGITKKLEYIQNNIRANTIMLGPIFEADETHALYAVKDFMKVSPLIGTMKDLTSLIAKVHSMEMHIILNIPIGSTSKAHEWFKDKPAYYKTGSFDYKNHHNTSATTDGKLTSDSPEMFDLNLEDKEVKKEIAKILTFWLGKGIDGFMIGYAEDLVDSGEHEVSEETYTLLTEWRALVEKQTAKSWTGAKVLFGIEGGAKDDLKSYYALKSKPGLHSAISDGLGKLKKDCDGGCVGDLLNITSTIAKGLWQSWMISDYHIVRPGTRMNKTHNKLALMLLMTFPGTPIVFYGDEIGLRSKKEDATKTGAGTGATTKAPTEAPSTNETTGRKKRAEPAAAAADVGRQDGIMQWHTRNKFGGFTEGKKTFGPEAVHLGTDNVVTQMAYGLEVSNLKLYKVLADLKMNENSLKFGTYKPLVQKTGSFPGHGEQIFGYVRDAYGFSTLIIVANFGKKAASIDLSLSKIKKREGALVFDTEEVIPYIDYKDMEKLSLSILYLEPGHGRIYLLF